LQDAHTDNSLKLQRPSSRHGAFQVWAALPGRSSVAVLAEHYRFPPSLTGKGECIGILAFGGGARYSELVRFFERETGIVPELRFKNSSPANQSNRNSHHDAETMLDIQVAGALAPGARIVTYFADNHENGWIDGLSRAIHDEENRPSVLSISWGATEDWWKLKTIQTLNELFETAAGLGITICAASGDDGCGTDLDGHCRVTFPASSPFVLACGGTASTPVNGEVVWNVKNASASGGGISDRVPRPNWQPKFNEVFSSRLPSRRDPAFDGRQLPDVSGPAGYSYNVYVNGIYRNSVGGTSAVAPLWSALIARLNEGLRSRGLPPLGHFHPRLYRERSIQQTFHRIIAGHNDPFGNKGYQAGPGWNFCSGWGSPDGVKLLEALSC